MTAATFSPYLVEIPDRQSVRRFSDRDHTSIVSWNRHRCGRHFAARDATDLRSLTSAASIDRCVTTPDTAGQER
jgi:hypothetical protein